MRGRRASSARLSGGAARAGQLLALLLVAPACPRVSEDLSLLEVLPDPRAGPLQLNAQLTLVFDAKVDPSSVTDAAVRLRLGDGRQARGTFSVRGNRVIFTPAAVLTPALDGGGYGGGGDLLLELPGFPSRTGVLSAAGRALAGTHRSRFRIVDPTVEAPRAALFQDPRPGAGPALVNQLKVPGAEFALVRPGGVIRLRFSEPLDPASVHSRRLRLLYDNPDRDPVDTEIRLLENRMEAVVELRPTDGFRLDDTLYILVLGDPGVTDLVGSGYDPAAIQEVRIRVSASGEALLGSEP